MNIPILVPTHTYEIHLPPLSSLRPLQCLSVPPPPTKKKIQVVETKAFILGSFCLLPAMACPVRSITVSLVVLASFIEHSTSCALAQSYLTFPGIL